MKESVDGWFKLLSQDEGEFYAVPVLADEGSMKIKTPTKVSRSNVNANERTQYVQEPKLPIAGLMIGSGLVSNMSEPAVGSLTLQTTTLKETDFHFVKVLGKGSFGKVRTNRGHTRSFEFNTMIFFFLLALFQVVLGEHKKNLGELFAIKILKKDIVVQDDDVECVMIEKRVLMLADKPKCLVQLHSCFQSEVNALLTIDLSSSFDKSVHLPFRIDCIS
jgi:serine/threonine protein kinase